MASSSAGGAFKVVFVCTGNRARSPLAEALFRGYASNLDVVVRSVGMLDVEGLPALPEAIAAGQKLGLDLTEHRSRTLRDGGLAGVDLVLGFEPDHLAAAIIEGGADWGRTFLLGELVDLLDASVPSEDAWTYARTMVAVADARRARTRPDVRRSIEDPLNKPARAVLKIAREIDRLVAEAVQSLFGLER
jgi:protein-tyrosine phosphatase